MKPQIIRKKISPAVVKEGMIFRRESLKLLSLVGALFLFSVICSHSLAQSVEQTHTLAYEEISKTEGFLIGQHYSLERIKGEFPNISSKVQIVEKEFASSFGTAERAITLKLQDLFQDKYAELQLASKTEIITNLKKQALTQEDALFFIAEVSNRAKGNIKSPMLETLLAAQYQDNPSEEFSRKYIRSFSTKNHAKAKDVDITFSYPISWKASEGDRPNIVQKFKSENGHGLEMFLIAIKNLPLPEEHIISEEELEGFISENGLKEIMPEDSKVISTKSVVLDNHKAGWALFEKIAQNLDITTAMRTQIYMTIVNNKLVLLQFTVMDKKGSSLQARLDKYEPLFKMIANSLVIQDQYREGYANKSDLTVKSSDLTNTVDSNSLKEMPPAFSGSNLAFSFIITWSIGLFPPLLIRFLLWRKPIKKWAAIGIASGFWIINYVIFVGLLGSQSNSHLAILLIAYATYGLLKYEKKHPAPPISTG